MEFLNKVELKGIVGKSTIQNCGEAQVCRFTAVTEYVSRDKDGNATIEPTWWLCVVTTKYNDEPQSISKGDKVHVVGRLRIVKYTAPDGAERIFNEIVVQSVETIDE